VVIYYPLLSRSLICGRPKHSLSGRNQRGIEMCEAWWDMILYIPETYDLTGQNRIEVLWRTLIADRIVGFSESRPQDFSECFRLMVKLKYGRILIEGQEATETHSLFWRALTSYRELLKETSPERLAPEAEIEEYAASLKKAKHDNKLSAEDQRILGRCMKSWENSTITLCTA